MTPSQLLARWPLLDLLGRTWLDSWLAQGEEVRLATGEVLCQAGSYARWVYLVQDGSIRVLGQAATEGEVSLGIFGSGELFGEYSLLPPGVVPATCRARGPTRIFRLKLRVLKLALAELPSVFQALRPWLRLHALLRHLRGGAFLGFMSAPSFLPLQDRFRLLKIPAGHSVQAEGLADDCWFFVRAGSLKVGDATFTAGDGFGAAALADRPDLPAAQTVEDTECLVLTRQDFLAPLEGEGPANRMSVEAPARRAMTYPHVAQASDTDCGPAALAMAARACGRSVSLEQVRSLVSVGRRGCNMEELLVGAEKLGFRARSVRIGPDQLAGLRLPAIALMLASHWVVLHACAGDAVVIGDPASAVKSVARTDFERQWTGHVLLLSPPTNTGDPLMASWIVE